MGSSSAAIFKDGKLLFAVEEERLSRIKNDDAFPFKSIQECLSVVGVTIKDIEIISVYWQPWRIFIRTYNTLKKLILIKDGYKVIFNIIKKTLFSKKQFISESNKYNENGSWFDLFMVRKKISQRFGKYSGRILYFDHHKTHRKYAEAINNWDEFISLSYDGGGEDHSTVITVTKDNKTSVLKKINWPNSLGHFYSYFTGFLGFKMLEGEYKMMGLAPLGKPKYKKILLQKILKLKSHGEYEFDNNLCDYHMALKGKFSSIVEEIICPARKKSDSELTRDQIDLASSVQVVFEEALCHMLNWVKNKHPNIKNLILSGGCALNVSANGKILRNKIFDKISLPPAPHDAGCSIGSGILAIIKIGKGHLIDRKSISNPYLGKSYSNDYIKKVFEDLKLPIPNKFSELELIDITTDALKKKQIVSWFQDKSEFGPRALGNRSFLADPRDDSIRDEINSKIKKRELFRPFAPSCTAESIKDFFDIDQESPYMNIVTKVKDEKKDLIPAVIHTDGTARVHTVSKDNNSLYHKLISNFGEKTGVPVLLNTSFNIQEPIVYSPKDAILTFLNSNVDLLVLGSFICDNSWRKNANLVAGDGFEPPTSRL